MPKKLRKEAEIKIRITKKDRERIDFLTAHYEQTISSLIRGLIQNKYAEIKNGE